MTENAALRYIQADIQPPDPQEVNWQDQPLPFKLYRKCEHIPLGHNTGEIGQMLMDIYGLTRQSYSTAMSTPILKSLLKTKLYPMEFITGLLRPVPSGGALFPCELYLLVADRGNGRMADPLQSPSPYAGQEHHYAGQDQHLPAGIYHYDAAHHALDILKQGDYSSFLQSALAHPDDAPPTYTLVLSCYFWKDGFKYGAFGYRLQGLDIGTVIGQSEIVTHHAKLSTTIHYQFQDKALNDLLGLDSMHESVYAVITWKLGANEASPQKTEEGAWRAEEPALPEIEVNPAATTRGASSACNEVSSVEAASHSHSLPLGTINTSPLETNKTSPGSLIESIARWPLPAEVHRASLIATREAFRPLCSLAPIQLPPGEGSKTLPLTTNTPLDLWEARTKRHSAGGTFLPTPLTKQQLSQLLLMSMPGMSNDLDGQRDFPQHTLLYCIVFRVQDIPAGIYVYQPDRHALVLVRAEVTQHKFHEVLRWPSQNLFYMSVCLFPVANYTSGIQAYGDRWYRMQNMEAGIIAQRLYLAAAALKLGCRASLSFKVPQTNTLLGLAEGYSSLIQIMIAPESPTYQHYEQSLLH